MVSPLISDTTAESIKQLARRGFATALAVADPAMTTVDIWRLNESTGVYEVVIDDQEFRIRPDNYQAAEGGDESIRAVAVSGTIRRFVPESGERLKPGDRFEIPSAGGAVIRSILPDKFGIESASWELERGAS